MINIVWENDGQGEFDFDYLENLTDAEFASYVQRDISRDGFKALKVAFYGYLVTTICVYDHQIFVRNYDKDTCFKTYSSFSVDNLDWIGSVLHG